MIKQFQLKLNTEAPEFCHGESSALEVWTHTDPQIHDVLREIDMIDEWETAWNFLAKTFNPEDRHPRTWTNEVFGGDMGFCLIIFQSVGFNEKPAQMGLVFAVRMNTQYSPQRCLAALTNAGTTFAHQWCAMVTNTPDGVMRWTEPLPE